MPEYTDGKGRKHDRDNSVGRAESQKRRTFLDSFLPVFRKKNLIAPWENYMT